MKLSIFVGILQVLSFEFLKFRILEILNFLPCIYQKLSTKLNLVIQGQSSCKVEYGSLMMFEGMANSV